MYVFFNVNQKYSDSKIFLQEKNTKEDERKKNCSEYFVNKKNRFISVFLGNIFDNCYIKPIWKPDECAVV